MIGRWRIVEADLWDRGHLDLMELAMIAIGADGHGEIALGALQVGLDIGYSQYLVHFTRTKFDEMDEVSGDGHAELLDNGAIKITSCIKMATRPSSPPNERLLQQPATRR
jgi:hypothetical protein